MKRNIVSRRTILGRNSKPSFMTSFITNSGEIPRQSQKSHRLVVHRDLPKVLGLVVASYDR